MKILSIICGLLLIAIISTSFKANENYYEADVYLDVSYIQTMGGSASIQNTSTNVIYNITAVDTFGSVTVPYGNYTVLNASTNSCNPPLMSNVTTSTGYFDFTVDGSSAFTIYASCY